MKAVGYFVEGSLRDGVERTVGQQHQAFLDFANAHGYEVAATFVDTRNGHEAGYHQLIEFLDRGDHGFVVVVVDGLEVLGSDLGRGALRALAIEAAGAQVYDASSGLEVTREIVDTWANQGEGTPASERVRAAMRRKAIRGEALGRPPYGYRIGPRRKFEIVPEEAVVVRYIYRLYLQQDLGIRRIAGQLNEDGITTRRGGRWSMVSVRDILRNRVYLGTYSRFGVRVPDSHPALVGAEDFKKVQQRMQSRNRGGRERTVQPFLLSGLAYCGECGNRMIGVSRRQKWTTRDGEEKKALYRYYQCESRTNQNACSYNTQRTDELEAEIRDQLAGGSEGGVTRLHRATNPESYLDELRSQVDRLDGRMRRNRRQVEELVADAAHGHLTLDRMKALGSEIAGQQSRLEAERAEAEGRLDTHRTEAEQTELLLETRERLVRDWDRLSFEQQRTLLQTVIDRIEVNPEHDVKLYLRP